MAMLSAFHMNLNQIHFVHYDFEAMWMWMWTETKKLLPTKKTQKFMK